MVGEYLHFGLLWCKENSPLSHGITLQIPTAVDTDALDDCFAVKIAFRSLNCHIGTANLLLDVAGDTTHIILSNNLPNRPLRHGSYPAPFCRTLLMYIVDTRNKWIIEFCEMAALTLETTCHFAAVCGCSTFCTWGVRYMYVCSGLLITPSSLHY